MGRCMSYTSTVTYARNEEDGGLDPRRVSRIHTALPLQAVSPKKYFKRIPLRKQMPGRGQNIQATLGIVQRS